MMTSMVQAKDWRNQAMNLRDLRYVCALVEHRHFGRAAEACFVSQPTLSGQVRKLEEWLGLPLFERTSRRVQPTAAGTAIAAHARTILREAAEIERLARDWRDPEAGPLRLGLIPTVAPALLPLCLIPLRRRFPKLQPVFIEEQTDALLHRLVEGDLDTAILATTPEETGLRCLPLYREPFLLALPEGHELAVAGPAAAEPVAMEKLEGETLLLLADGHCLRDQALEACAVAAAPGPGDTTATSMETLLSLVAAGSGVTLVPALTARDGPNGATVRRKGIALRRLDDPKAARSIALCCRAGFPRQSLLEAMAACIRGVLTEDVTPLEPGSPGLE